MAVADESREAHRPGFLALVATAVLVGVLAGLFFGLRDSARIMVADFTTEAAKSLPRRLSFSAYAMFWYGLAGAVLVGAGGGAVWLLICVGGHRSGGPRLVGLLGGVATFVCVSFAVLSPTEPATNQQRPTTGPMQPVDAALLGILCALGMGAVLACLQRRLGQPRRLAALAVAVLVALYVLVVAGLWLEAAVLPGLGAMRKLGRRALLLAVAAVTAKGSYDITLALLGWRAQGARRRGLRGILLTVVALAAFVAWPVRAHYRGHRSREPGQRAAQPASPRRPNILWLILDTARADALSCYGYSRKTTPYLDGFASEATLYERAYVTGGWTLPSHASMFTGVLPCRHGATAECLWLRDSSTTLAEILSQHGYKTFCYSNNAYLTRGNNMDQGFQVFEQYYYGRTWERRLLLNQVPEVLHWTDDGARAANRAVLRWVADCTTRGLPFFIFVNYMEIHSPYGSTPAWRRWAQDGAPDAAPLPPEAALLPAKDGKGARVFAAHRTLYDGDATYLDARIGELIESLRRLGILDDTFVIVTSDHGEEFGEHGISQHAFSLYNTLLHVPLIIRYPARFAPGARVRDLVCLADLFPTLLELLRIPWTGETDGVSLFAPAPADRPRYVFAERAVPVSWITRNMLRPRPATAASPIRRFACVQDRRYKYLWASDGNDELYDLESDPREERNLISTLPDKAKELRAILETRVGGFRRYAIGGTLEDGPARPPQEADPDGDSQP